MTGSRIVFEVTGDPAGLKTTVDQSVASLGKLQSAAERAAKSTQAAGDKTTATNRRVGESFGGVARDADKAAASLSKSFEAQERAAQKAIVAAERVSAAQRAEADATDDASAKIAGSVLLRARRAQAAADIEVAATRRVTEAQVQSAQVVIASLRDESAALERQAARARETSTVVSSSAERSAKATTGAADQQIAASQRVARASEESAQRSRAAFGTSEAGITKSGKLITLGLLGIGAAAVYGAAKFQTATTQYVTQAGAGVEQTKKLSKGLLDMAGAVGQTPNELAKGMYHIVSALNNLIPPAHRVRDELGILREAAKGAAIGNANLNDTTYALSSAMNALGQTTVPQARKTMAELNAIVGSGDMHMQDLVNAMNTGLVPSAKSFGVSLRSVGAALAYMTDTGVPAQMAATRLRMSLSLLGAPTAKSAGLLETIGDSAKDATARTTAMAKALDAAGLHTSQLSADLRKPDGILVALEDLKAHFRSAGVTASAQGAFISSAFGGGKSGSAIEALFNNLDKLKSKYAQVGDSVKKYGGDWSKTQDTLNFQLHQIEGQVEAVGIKIGDALIPKVEDAFKMLREFGHWLDKNRAAAALLAGVITGLATVAIGSYLFSEVRKVTGLMRGLGSLTGFRAPSAFGGGGGILGQSRGLSIGGARSGLGLPGSATNPMIVAIEDGQYAGLGGQAATFGKSASAAEKDIARADQVAPTAVSQAERAAPTVVAAEAGGSGLVGSVLGGLRGALGGLLRGGLIAGSGVAASTVAGDVLGGSTGKTVQHVGTDISIGAGLGSLLGPEGTIAGGVAGALVAALTSTKTKADNWGQGIADKFTAGLKADLARPIPANIKLVTNLNQTISSTLAKAKSTTDKFNPSDFPLNAGDRRIQGGLFRERRQQEFKAGQQIGPEFAQVLSKESKFFSGGNQSATTDYIDQIEKKFAHLPDAARKGAVSSIIAITETFQKQGRLPEGATDDLVTSLESKWSDLGPTINAAVSGAMVNVQSTIQQAAATTTPVLNDMAAGKSALQKSQEFIAQLHTNWSNIPVIAKLTTGNTVTVFSETMADLQNIIQTRTGAQKQIAETAYKKLHDDSITYFTSMKQGINLQLNYIYQKMSAGGEISAQGTEAVESNYASMVQLLQKELASGAVQTKTGMAKIRTELETALRGLGYGSIADFEKKMKSANASFGPGVGQVGLGAAKTTASQGATGAIKQTAASITFAGGGLVQVGQPGQKGHDAIPMSVGGHNIMVGAGEQAAVFTHQQQAVANRYLAPVGGLPGLFTNVKTPHYMAGGGFVDTPGTNYTVGEEPILAQRLNALAKALGVTLTGISGYRTPQHSVEVGGFADDPHTRGDASDTQGAQGIPEATLEKFGLTRPFSGAAEADHIQLLAAALGPILQSAGGAKGAGVSSPGVTILG